MATVYFIGGAPVVRNKHKIALTGTWNDASATLTVTIGGKSLILTIVVSSGSATKSEIAAALVEMCSGSTISLSDGTNTTFTANGLGKDIGTFAECTFEADGDDLIIYGPEDGAPITVACSDTSAGTATASELQAESGPYDYNTAINWSGGSVPGVNDTVIFDHRARNGVRYGLDQSYIVYTSFIVYESFQYEIGLPATNTRQVSYPEYRDRFLKILPSEALIRGGRGSMNIDTGSSGPSNVTVSRASQLLGDGITSVNIKGSNVSPLNVYNFSRGDITYDGICGNLYIGSDGQGLNDTFVFLPAGSTLTGGTTYMRGGTVINYNALTTLEAGGGLWKQMDGAITTASLDNCTLEQQGADTITTLNIGKGALADFSKNTTARTVTNCTIVAGGGYKDPGGTVTLTNGIDLYRCRPKDLTVFDIPIHKTITLSAI